MLNKTLEKGTVNQSKFILAIHNTNNYFGFGCKDLRIKNSKDIFFIKKLDKDLSKHLIIDLTEFLKKKQLNCIERIAISVGPANFNASRQIVVCARAISQQINCSLDNYSSFHLMAKRITIENKIIENNQAFWIFKKLKRRGYVAGKYKPIYENNNYGNICIKEIISPKLYNKFSNKEQNFEAEYDIRNELKELLELSFINYRKLIFNSWENVLPIYPIEAVN